MLFNSPEFLLFLPIVFGWPDSLFRDSDHLNSLGGRKLGGILHELMLE